MMMLVLGLSVLAPLLPISRAVYRYFSGVTSSNTGYVERSAASIEGWKVLGGLLPGAAIAALLITSTVMWSLVPILPISAVALTRLGFLVLAVLIASPLVFLPSFLVCGLCLFLTMPLWIFLCRRANPGPWVAAAFGAVAGSAFGDYLVLAMHEPKNLWGLVACFTIAGFAAGATTWWAAYRSDALRLLWPCLLACRRPLVG